jgi:hypothetical protein
MMGKRGVPRAPVAKAAHINCLSQTPISQELYMCIWLLEHTWVHAHSQAAHTPILACLFFPMYSWPSRVHASGPHIVQTNIWIYRPSHGLNQHLDTPRLQYLQTVDSPSCLLHRCVPARPSLLHRHARPCSPLPRTCTTSLDLEP